MTACVSEFSITRLSILRKIVFFSLCLPYLLSLACTFLKYMYVYCSTVPSCFRDGAARSAPLKIQKRGNDFCPICKLFQFSRFAL